MKKLIIALAALTILTEPCLAQQEKYTITAKMTEQQIKLYDPLVRSVGSDIPATKGTKTDCGFVGEGSTVAFYCPEQKNVFVSDRTLKEVGDEYGGEGIAVLIAHEYAHARQHAMQGFTRQIIWTSVVDELQADCVAGVYLKRGGEVKLTDEMINRAAHFLENIGDYLPLEQDWHGSPEMRKNIFLYGYKEGSLNSCLASTDMNFNTILSDPSGSLKKQLKDPENHLKQLLDWGVDLIQGK